MLKWEGVSPFPTWAEWKAEQQRRYVCCSRARGWQPDNDGETGDEKRHVKHGNEQDHGPAGLNSRRRHHYNVVEIVSHSKQLFPDATKNPVPFPSLKPFPRPV